MNQIKIGKFITICRKKVNLTQKQLADKLNITDRAVSKWENGISMPDFSIMIELCKLLNISVDELLNGEFSLSDNKKYITDKLFWFIRSLPLMMGLLALVLSIFTPGAIGLDGFNMNFEYRMLINYIFGGGNLYNVNELRGFIELTSLSGISYFGLLSFICLLISAILFIISVIKKKEKTYLLSNIMLVLSGILILFILVAGTNITSLEEWFSREFTFHHQYYRLGIGTVIWSIFCILGGLFGLCNKYIYNISNKNYNNIKPQ